MKFNTILSFAFTIAIAFAQMSDAEDNGAVAANGIISDVETNQVPDTADAGANISGADNTGFPSQNDGSAINNGEASDDYGDVAGIDALDGGETHDSGEASDNGAAADSGAYLQQNAMNPVPESAPATPQPVEFTGASGEAAPIANSLEAQNSPQGAEKPTVALDDASKSDEPMGTAKIASGLVGAACVSGAGVFFLLKRSKRRGLESVRSQISMA